MLRGSPSGGIIPTFNSLLQSSARGRDINEKKKPLEVRRTIKNCTSEISEDSSMTFASALCNAGRKSWLTVFLITEAPIR